MILYPASSPLKIALPYQVRRRGACSSTKRAVKEEAREACKSGDVRRASLYIHDLQSGGIRIEYLQLCLLDTVETEAHQPIRMLLVAGVPLSETVIKPALWRNSLRILSMFTEHGWDINCEEAWCIPQWLWYAPCKTIWSSSLTIDEG